MIFPDNYYFNDSTINEEQEKKIMNYAEYNMKYLIARFDYIDSKKENAKNIIQDAYKQLLAIMPTIKDIHMTINEGNIYMLMAAAKMQRLDVLYNYVGDLTSINKLYEELYILQEELDKYKKELSTYNDIIYDLILNINKKRIQQIENELRVIPHKITIELKKFAENYFADSESTILKRQNELAAWIYPLTYEQAHHQYQLEYQRSQTNKRFKKPCFSRICSRILLTHMASILKNSRIDIDIIKKTDDRITAIVNESVCTVFKRKKNIVEFHCSADEKNTYTVFDTDFNIGKKRIGQFYSIFINNIYKDSIRDQYIYASSNSKKILGKNDTIVKSNIYYCGNNNHDIIDVIAKVQVKETTGDIVWNYLHAGYCQDCNRYYILKEDYNKLSGIPLCQVLEIKNGKEKIISKSHSEYIKKYESIIHSYGYNVNANDNLTDEKRQTILVNLINNKIVSQEIVLSYLDSLIQKWSGNIKYNNAVQKWISDRRYVEQQWISHKKYLVDTIVKYN